MDGVKIIFPNSIPLLNPKPPKYSSRQTHALFPKTKKGSSIYRKILDRDLEFKTTRLKSWRKTTGDTTVEMKTVRNTFKSINSKDIPASDHDALVRLYLRKTTFNNQTTRSTQIKQQDLNAHKGLTVGPVTPTGDNFTLRQ